MNLREIQNIFKRSLKNLYDKDETATIIRTVLMEALNYSTADLILKDQEVVSFETEEQLLKILERLKQAEPVQYVLGYAWFCGLRFKVNKYVLIPRPETEELVDWIVKQNKIQSPHILDIGTGSGCIAIALAKQIPEATVVAKDISKDALNTATQNALINNVDVKFLEADILNQHSNEIKYDIIVSNPPYVLQSESETMCRHVLQYEPATALFVPDDDALIFYKAILKYAGIHLKPGGKLFFEINPFKAEEITALLKSSNFIELSIKKDLQGRDRMVMGTK